MIKKVMITAAVIFFAGGFLSTPALASHCPKDVKLIKAAMSKMDAKKKSMAMEAADKGLALHKAGKHGESIKILHGVMESLGISH